MARVSSSHLKKLDKQHRANLVKEKKKYSRYPSAVTTERDKDVHITQKTLRPYFTLANDLYKQNGELRKTATNVSRQFIRNKIIRRDAENRLYRKRLRETDIGKMFTFMYDPKHKATLDYYDRIPLVIPLVIHRDGFTGISMHHIEPKIRLVLLERFKKFKSLDDLRAFMRLTYELIMKNPSFKFARPLIRRYLYNHMLGIMVIIPESDWEIMQVIPSLEFAKRKEASVWLENRAKGLRS